MVLFPFCTPVYYHELTQSQFLVCEIGVWGRQWGFVMFDMLAAEDVCIFSLEDIGGDKLDLSMSSCISWSV